MISHLTPQYLVENYYKMPVSSVDEISVYSNYNDEEVPEPNEDEDRKYLTVPTLTITRSPVDGEDGDVDSDEDDSIIEVYNLYNSTSGWPLSKEGSLQIAANSPVDPMYIGDFFENLIEMEFLLMVKTDGYTGGEFSKRYELCVYWQVAVKYSKGSRGQIR